MPSKAARASAAAHSMCSTCCARRAEVGKRTCEVCLRDRADRSARVHGFLPCCQAHGTHRTDCREIAPRRVSGPRTTTTQEPTMSTGG